MKAGLVSTPSQTVKGAESSPKKKPTPSDIQRTITYPILRKGTNISKSDLETAFA